MASSSLQLLVLGCCLAGCAAGVGNFRGMRDGPGYSVSTQEIESSLREAMEAVLRGGYDSTAKQLARIEARTWQTYQALPKNEFGRLSPRGVRYVVHGYFAREHGWMISGLDPHGNQANVSEVHGVSILQDRAPALVESLLEAQRANHGLSMNDVVAMVAALERLILDESVILLETAYKFNGFTPTETLDDASMKSVLLSYLILFHQNDKADLTDIKRHTRIKDQSAKLLGTAKGAYWDSLTDFTENTVLNYNFAKQHQTNPFVRRSYDFQASLEVAEELSLAYGKWQNPDCTKMKNQLVDLAPDGAGRVPLSTLYSATDTDVFSFTETEDYLRQIGALEENAGGPKVRIANYMAGPANCVFTRTYYSICCLSECEGLMNELEAKVRAPSTSPEHLLSVVTNMTSSSMDGPLLLPSEMTQRLHSIADRHGGEVPLHGRLFAEWLHYAFPNECPYPAVIKDTVVFTSSHWKDKTVSVEDAERLRLANATPAVAANASQGQDMAWSDEELLHVPGAAVKPRNEVGVALRVVAQLSVLLALLRAAWGGWQSAAGASHRCPGKGKRQVPALPY